MHALTSWFIRNPVAANLTMVLILVAGLQAAWNMRVEGFPQIPTDIVEVSTEMLGATPDQIDSQVTSKIERALEGLDGVRAVTSRSGRDRSLVLVRKTFEQDMDELVDAIRLRVDRINGLPGRAEDPQVDIEIVEDTAIRVTLHGTSDVRTQQRLAHDLLDKLQDRPEISRTRTHGLLTGEVEIALDPVLLRLLDLTAEDVRTRIQQRSVNAPPGTLRTATGTVSLRADSTAQFAPDFADIPIIELADGRNVVLDDVATITDGYRERDALYRFNGASAVTINVIVGANDDLLAIAKATNSVAAEFAEGLPDGLDLTVWGDGSRYIDDRLDLLQSNGLLGLFLILVLLALFLDVRLAFWVAVGLPVAILGALAVAGSSWFDYTLNDITTYGLIIALGILVDDAVIVGESVFEARQNNPDPIAGTEAGVFAVATPTIFGVGTTIAAFLPMALISNDLGKVLAGFSGMVVLALLFSLFESKCLLPAHLAQVDLSRQPTGIWSRCQKAARGGLHAVRDGPYQAVLRLALYHRYALLIAASTLVVLGIGLANKDRVPVTFFPELPQQVVWVRMDMDSRAPASLTVKNLAQVEQAGQALSERLAGENNLNAAPIKSFKTFYGGGESAWVGAELTPIPDRPGLSSSQLAQMWRDSVGALEGMVNIRFGEADALGGGFSLRLMGDDIASLRAAGAELETALSQIAGVSNVRASLSGGQSELRVMLRPQAIGLGVTPEALAQQIGSNFGGVEVQRVLRDGQELEVRLRLEASARDQVSDIQDARIRSDSGAWLPVSAIATVGGTYAPAMVERFNGNLLNQVSATLDRSIVSSGDVADAMFDGTLPKILERYPGVVLAPGGAVEEQEDIEAGLIGAMLVSLLAIYLLLAVPLKSYVQPFLILAVLPFGFLGAAAGHWVLGLPLSMLSFFGMLALAGIMVNDSLVMLTRYHTLRAESLDVTAAITGAATSRFQAIFLTTATTVIGLGPMIAETSEQAQILIPAAISLAFGLLAATLVTLVLLPALLACYEDLVSKPARRGLAA
ncbi:MAG: efflux RND transporter permease subunit [Pseudomonadota bacterium]